MMDLQDFKPSSCSAWLLFSVIVGVNCSNNNNNNKKEHECCRYLFPPTYTLFPAYASYRNYSHFVIYEHIALSSTLWIYADSLWDQFNSSWGMRGEKP